MTIKIYEKSYSKLDDWIQRNSYRGYDAYDGLNSERVKKVARGNYSRLFFTRLSVNFPLNLRPLLGIRPSSGTKALSLISRSYMKRFKSTRNPEKLLKAKKLLKIITSISLKEKYGEHCWNSHLFDIQIGKTHIPFDTPCMVGTIYPSFAFFESLSNISKKDKLSLDIIESSAKYMINELLTEAQGKTYFRYRNFTPQNHITHGVNAIGASFFARLFYLTKNSDYLRISRDCIDTTLNYQNSKGYWYYSQKSNGEILNEQIDFHQGLILDSIIDFIKFVNPKEKRYLSSLIKGANFYQKEQFLSDGRAKLRWPRLWPIDIHNQAQGIITFSKLSRFDPKYLIFSEEIARWTINNMQDEEGFFYHQKWPFLTNKTPLFRWGQAWMMLSLSELIKNLEINENINIKQ